VALDMVDLDMVDLLVRCRAALKNFFSFAEFSSLSLSVKYFFAHFM
jgi:hypothetical protein